MPTVTTGPEPDDVGDEGGVPVELIDLFIAIEEGATHEEFAELAEAGWPAPEQD